LDSGEGVRLGCTALTGVEGKQRVQAFKEPVVAAARRTLAAIIAILIVLLGGIALLVKYYGIMATDPGRRDIRVCCRC